MAQQTALPQQFWRPRESFLGRRALRLVLFKFTPQCKPILLLLYLEHIQAGFDSAVAARE